MHAKLIALAEIAGGVVILSEAVNIEALILGLLALVWYNGVYTPMKKMTPHAVIPGSLIGAIPPLAGWAGSGASLADPRAWAMALFFFIWQVPHFYLLVLKYGPQYEQAGFPALTHRLSKKALRRLILVWVICTALAALSLYQFGVIRSVVSVSLLFLSSMWVITLFAIPALNESINFRPIRYFMRFNYYVLFVILVLNADHLFTHLLN